MTIDIEFVPRDIWVGVYVAPREKHIPWTRRVYVCVIPMFPLIFSWTPAVRL